MSEGRPTLRSLLDEWRDSKGAARMMIRYKIQAYMDTIPLEYFEKEVGDVRDPFELRILIGAGPSGYKYKVVMRRSMEIW